MALINCPECGREISEMATACPHCGYEIKKDKTKKKKSDSGNLLSKITVTNALALIIQVTLVVFLFMNLISMGYVKEEMADEIWTRGSEKYSIKNDSKDDLDGSKDFSIAKLSFKNLDNYFKNKFKSNYTDDGEFKIINDGFSGAQVGFILLIVLFVIEVGMMIFEFVKNKLLIKPLFSSVIVFITGAYAIVAYIFLTNLRGVYTYTYEGWSSNWVSGDYAYDIERGYYFGTKGTSMGTLFIILCIVCCVIKLINYWLHYDNKTETIKTISFKKMFKKSKGIKEEIK